MTAAGLEAAALALSQKTGSPYAHVREWLGGMEPAMRAAILEAAGVSFTPNGAKLGRPPSKTLQALRAAYPQLSPRSITRLDNALRMLHEAQVDEPGRRQLLEDCTRASGSFNVSRFERLAEDVWRAMWIDPYVGAAP